MTQIVRAAQIHADQFDRSGAWLICKTCHARIEPSMVGTHRKSAACQMRYGLARAERLGLVRIESICMKTRDLDRDGLVVWIGTDLTDEGELMQEAWTRPVVLGIIRSRAFEALDDAGRKRSLHRLSELPIRSLGTIPMEFWAEAE